MVEAVGQVRRIDRRRCREAFDARFTADRMARDYVALYERIIEERMVQTAPMAQGLGSRQVSGDTFKTGRHQGTPVLGRG